MDQPVGVELSLDSPKRVGMCPTATQTVMIAAGIHRRPETGEAGGAVRGAGIGLLGRGEDFMPIVLHADDGPSALWGIPQCLDQRTTAGGVGVVLILPDPVGMAHQYAQAGPGIVDGGVFEHLLVAVAASCMGW